MAGALQTAGAALLAEHEKSVASAASETAVVAPDQALAQHDSSAEVDGELSVKPKAAFKVGVPDKLPEDGQQDATTSGSGRAKEETAVAAKPRAKRRVRKISKITLNQILARANAFRQQENLLKVEDHISEADWASVPDKDCESIDSGAETQLDANHAQDEGASPADPRRRSPSRWVPSPMTVRGPSTHRQDKGKRVRDFGPGQIRLQSRRRGFGPSRPTRNECLQRGGSDNFAQGRQTQRNSPLASLRRDA